MATLASYNEGKQSLTKQIRLVTTAIKSYTAEDVEEFDARTNGCSKLLKIIREKLELATNIADEILEDVEGERNLVTRQNRTIEIEALKDDIIRKVKENEKAVKAAAVAFLTVDVGEEGGAGGAAAAAVAAANATAAEEAEKTKRGKQAKLQVMQRQVTVKAKDLKAKVCKVADPKTLKEVEVREALLDSKDWLKKMEEIQKLTDQMEQDGAVLGIDIKTEIEFCEQAADAVTTKIEALKIEDKAKGYYAAGGAKPKDVVVYPKPFKGILGSNVYKFCKEMTAAIESAQIKEEDKVRKLLEFLEGDAKVKVGEYHKTLSSAMESLQNYYGNPRAIWAKCRRD